MIRLDVWRRTPQGVLLRAGRLVVSDPDPLHGGMRGEFRYDAEYRERDDAIALDPINLPLSDQTFRGLPPDGLPGAIEDALPDSWGRAMLCRAHQIPRARQRGAHLLEHLGAQALGALSFSPARQKPQAPQPPPPLGELSTLEAAARAYERQEPIDDAALARLFQAGSSPGGARPKVLIQEGASERKHTAGQAWLAKFASSRDTLGLVRIEAATLATARAAGLSVPAFRVQPLGRRREALLVARFDVSPSAPGGRYHQLSFQSLLGAQGYYRLGYRDLADGLRQASSRPGEDLPALARQMMFNALIGNTDDHLKNVSLRHDGAHWRLSPAYDLLPDVGDNREHVLHFGQDGNRARPGTLEREARAFGLSTRQSETLLAEVIEGVRSFPAQCDRYGVPARERDLLLDRMRLFQALTQPARTDTPADAIDQNGPSIR